MKRDYDKVHIEILDLQGSDVVAASPVDPEKENIGDFDYGWLSGGGIDE